MAAPGDSAAMVAEAVAALRALEDGGEPLAVAAILDRVAARLTRAAGELRWRALADEARRPPAVPPPLPGMAAGPRVRQVRQALGLTRSDLAEAAGVSAATLRTLEGGEAPVSRRVVRLVAGGLAKGAGGNLDPSGLAQALCAMLAVDGLLSSFQMSAYASLSAGEVEDRWVERRLGRALSAERLAQRLAARRLAALAGDEP